MTPLVVIQGGKFILAPMPVEYRYLPLQGPPMRGKKRPILPPSGTTGTLRNKVSHLRGEVDFRPVAKPPRGAQ